MEYCFMTDIYEGATKEKKKGKACVGKNGWPSTVIKLRLSVL